MKYSTVFVAAALASGAAAQDLSQLPQCARAAALQGITSTGCQLTDIACICRSTSFLESVASAIQSTCTPAEQQQTYAFAESLCSSAGVSISTPGAGAGSSTAAPSSTEASSSAVETTTEAETTTAVETTTEAATESATSVAVTESDSAIPTATETSAPAETSAPVETSAPATYPAGNGTTALPTVVPVPTNNGTAVTPTNSGIPSPTFESSAANKAGSVFFSLAIAVAAVLAL